MLSDVLAGLEEACERTQDLGELRGRLDELSWSLLYATLGAAPPPRWPGWRLRPLRTGTG